MKKFMLLHGVNHNMFGKRNPEQYGTITLDEINGRVMALADELNVSVTCFQTNSEGAMVDKIKRQAEKAGAMVKLIAPKMNVTLKGGRVQAADGQLAGSPSVLCDAVASVLAPEQG